MFDGTVYASLISICKIWNTIIAIFQITERNKYDMVNLVSVT